MPASGAGAGGTSVSVIMPYKNSFDTFNVHGTEYNSMPGAVTEEDLSLSFDTSSGDEYYDAIASYTSGVVNKYGDVVKKKKICFYTCIFY